MCVAIVAVSLLIEMASMIQDLRMDACFGDVVWKKPTVAAILQILKNPAYAGAFVYGKTRSVRKDPTSPHTQEVRLPMDQWKIRINDVYPAYIAWETFEHIQAYAGRQLCGL